MPKNPLLDWRDGWTQQNSLFCNMILGIPGKCLWAAKPTQLCPSTPNPALNPGLHGLFMLQRKHWFLQTFPNSNNRDRFVMLLLMVLLTEDRCVVQQLWGVPRLPVGREGSWRDTFTPSSAGEGMQHINLEKFGCSHPAPIRWQWRYPSPWLAQHHPPWLLQAAQKQQIVHFYRSCQDPALGFSSLILFSRSPAPSVSFPNTRQAKHYFPMPASGTELWASLSACRWWDKWACFSIWLHKSIWKVVNKRVLHKKRNANATS